MLVPNLEWTPNRFGDPQIGNFDKSLPEQVRGSVAANSDITILSILAAR